MKYTFGIENVDCGNCAAKIERSLQQDTQVESCSLNFLLKKLEVTMKQDLGEEATRSYLEKKARKVEKDVSIIMFQATHASAPVGCGCGSSCGTGDGHSHHHEHEHGHGHGHGHSHEQEAQASSTSKENNWWKKNLLFIRLAASIVFLGIGMVSEQPLWTVLSYILIGYDVLLKAMTNMVRGKVFDENFLMAIATVAAFAIKEYPEAVAVMIFYQIGEYFQHRAVAYSRNAIASLMDIRPTFARVLRTTAQEVDPTAVQVGERIEVRAGEKIPLDGVVVEGTSSIDTSMLTGESVLVSVSAGMDVLSGSINKEGILIIEVQKAYGESTVSKILALIEDASGKKSVAENFITKFAKWYTPIVVFLALAVAVIPSIITGNWEHWIYTSIVFLVISCPCALVISIPLGFFGGIGAASKRGILVKGSNYLEKLNEIDTIVLDKTGTITKGQFGVAQILPSEGFSKEDVLNYCVPVEKYSSHPIAKSIVAYGKTVADVVVTDYAELGGYGIRANVSGKVVLVGNEKLMVKENIAYSLPKIHGTTVLVAVDGKYVGAIVVADQIKEDSKQAILDFRASGIKKVVMLTGDRKEAAEAVAQEVGIHTYFAELLPQDKVAKVEALLAEGHKVAFVGDGINDAPVLARADIGISMGGVGSDAAIEASDVVLMTDELKLIPIAKQIAAFTKTVVTQNIVLALGIKLIVMVLGLVGIASMWLAVFADVGVSLMAILNAMRILSKKNRF